MRTRANTTGLLQGALLLSLLIFSASIGTAQSLGEIARQQRARVGAGRIFTNEDLARPKILEATPQAATVEDVDAWTPAPAAPSLVSEPSAAPVPVWSAHTPLGDVARYYRQRKEQFAPLPAPQESEGLVVAAASESAPSPAPLPAATFSAPRQPVAKPKRVIANTSAAPVSDIPSGTRDEPSEILAAARVVRVSPGDSLWRIAGRHLGNPNQWREIAAANPEIADPNRIRAGQQLRLPEIAIASAVAANQIENQVRVQAGDSLWKLAKAQWGHGQAWSCIAESNPQIESSGRIYPGQVLTLPSLCSPIA